MNKRGKSLEVSRMRSWINYFAVRTRECAIRIVPSARCTGKWLGCYEHSTHTGAALRRFSIISSLLFSVASQAGGITPLVYIPSGASYSGQYTDPITACQTAIDSKLWNGSNETLIGIFINSYVNGVLIKNYVAPYNTPDLGGWDCLARVRVTSNGTFDVYPEFSFMYPACPAKWNPNIIGSGYYPRGETYCPAVPTYYVAAKPKDIAPAENGSCGETNSKAQMPKSFCGDPINPANGNTFSAQKDLSLVSGHSPGFIRSYNSADTERGTEGIGWRGSYSRSVAANFRVASYQPLNVAGSVVSSLYNDEASACLSGFGQIKSQLPSWSNATARFNNGVCNLMRGDEAIDVLPIYTAYDLNIAPEVSPLSLDYTSDDGQVIKFSVINGVITAPSSTGIRLAKLSTGYLLTDGNDSVEQYDANGKLLSVTSRSGVTQTMSYDGSDRLAGVSDSFGHQLTLDYNAQNHLIAVTRE